MLASWVPLPVQGEGRESPNSPADEEKHPSPSRKAPPCVGDFIGFVQHVIPIELRGGCAGVIR